MHYKTILLHADNARNATARLEFTAQLAQQQQAHLVCAAMTGISRFVYHTNGGGTDGGHPRDVIRPDLAERARLHAQATLEHYAAVTGRLGVSSCEHRLVDDDAYGGLLLQSRYADLLVVGQADRDDPATGSLLQDLPEYVVLNSCRPVLIVPFAGNLRPVGKQVVVAWDGSLQATRAITGALPLLAHADNVTVALFDAASGADEHGDEPGADIALYMARHGVQVDVVRQATDGDIGEAVLALADSVNADLLVMGAYGHARYREILLGGATRTVLNSMTVPVLMAH